MKLRRALDGLKVHQEELHAQNRKFRETQQQLELSRDHYANLYDLAPTGYVTLDKKGRIRELNLTAAKMLGRDRSRLLGQSFGGFVLKRDAKPFHDHLRRCGHGSPVTTELALALRARNPSQVQLRSIPVHDPVSKAMLIRTALTDISARKGTEEVLREAHDELEARVQERTADLARAITILRKQISRRKEAERARRKAEIRYRTLVEGIPAVTYSAALDELRTTLYISPQLDEVLGFSPKEWLADAAFWSKQLDPNDRDRVLAVFSRACQTGEPFRCEYRIAARDDRLVWVRDEAVIVKESSDQGGYVHGVMLDITERKRAEGTLRKLSGHLLQAQDKERRRIALELHDRTGQNLACLGMNLTELEKSAASLAPEAREILAGTVTLTQQCAREVRTLSYLLHPPTLDEFEIGRAHV